MQVIGKSVCVYIWQLKQPVRYGFQRSLCRYPGGYDKSEIMIWKRPSPIPRGRPSAKVNFLRPITYHYAPLTPLVSSYPAVPAFSLLSSTCRWQKQKGRGAR